MYLYYIKGELCGPEQALIKLWWAENFFYREQEIKFKHLGTYAATQIAQLPTMLMSTEGVESRPTTAGG